MLGDITRKDYVTYLCDFKERCRRQKQLAEEFVINLTHIAYHFHGCPQTPLGKSNR